MSYPLLALRYVSGKREVLSDATPYDARELQEACFVLRLPGGASHYLSVGASNARTT